MNSTKFILSLTKLCKKLEKEFPNKKGSIDSVRTFLYEIIDDLLPVNYDYRGQRVKLKAKKNEWETILDALNSAKESLDIKDYERLTDHLINIEANLLDISLAVKTVRKNILKIVDQINKTHLKE